MKPAWVYILRCSDGSYYTGCSTNLEARLYQHEQGYFANSYTSSRRPVELVWSEYFVDMFDAFAAEQQIKKWTRAKKEALMNGDFRLLKELSRSTTTKKKLEA